VICIAAKCQLHPTTNLEHSSPIVTHGVLPVCHRLCGKLVVASPKGDLVSFGFLSRHSRAGLWILPSLPGLVCGEDL
jgi:hypothetical protein